MNADSIVIEIEGATYVIGRVSLAKAVRLELAPDGRLVAYTHDGSFRSHYPKSPKGPKR